MTALFRFRQDLRLFDNCWLLAAYADSKKIIPVFIFDTDILAQFPEKDARLGFLIEAVQDLEKQFHKLWYNLIVKVGKSIEIIPELIKEHNCNTLYHNKSYGLGSISRDQQIERHCKDNGILYKNFSDYLLIEPEAIEQRKVFTPFYKLWQKKILTLNPSPSERDFRSSLPLSEPKGEVGGWGYSMNSNNRDQIISHLSPWKNRYRPINGWKKRLELDLSNYDLTRNHLPDDGTTKLSPYIRFWLVSIRQIYRNYISQGNAGSQIIISELARREFRHHIMYYFPHTRFQSFQEKRRGIQWENDPILFKAWCEGKTGYPVIDAAMRQLVEEKRMHNRARMIVASFLTKDLLIDRSRGEEFFAKHLLDYDSNVNIGNRQRAASVWADPKPLRIFSPILQAQRFDPNAVYIKKYLPELKGIDAYRLHDPLTYRIPYHTPIVNHVVAQRRARERYKE